jgi:hypothetical protein
MVRRRAMRRSGGGRNGRNNTYPDLVSVPSSSLRFTTSVSLATSSTSVVNWSSLTGASLGQPSRISSVELEVVSATTGLITVAIFDSLGNATTQTRPIAVGTAVSRFKVKNPKSTDFGNPVMTAGLPAVSFTNTGAGTIALTYIVNYAIKSL